MPSKNEKPQKSMGIALHIQKRLKENGSNPLRLSADIGYAYDHLRKIVKGDVFPSSKLLKLICEHLNLDFKDMNALLQADKAFDKEWTETYASEDPDITDIKRFWPHLNMLQKRQVKDLIKGFAAAA